jgi:hypothetical protein
MYDIMRQCNPDEHNDLLCLRVNEQVDLKHIGYAIELNMRTPYNELGSIDDYSLRQRPYFDTFWLSKWLKARGRK